MKRKRRNLPRNPEQMAIRLERIKEHARADSPMLKIPPIAASECLLVVHAYYGGPWHAIWNLIRMQLFLGYHGVRGSLIWRFCDLVGWTKVVHHPGNANALEHWRRHGKQCSGSPNCHDMDCSDRSIPRWFKKLVGWDKYYSA